MLKSLFFLFGQVGMSTLLVYQSGLHESSEMAMRHFDRHRLPDLIVVAVLNIL